MITIQDIKKIATDKVFYRGKEYYECNHVLETRMSKNKLFAEVEGSDIHPYSVEIHFSKSGKLQEAECDCPYDFKGICKHAVAVLLDYIENSKSISSPKIKASNKSTQKVSSPKVKVKEINEQMQILNLQTLAKMSKQELVDLVISLSEEKPELVTWMQNKINATQNKKNYLQGKSKNTTHFDLL